jgi:UDP-N-acetylmuramate dehydrogenase
MSESLKSYFSKPPSEFTGELRFDEPLARFTYYQIGGPASVLATPKSRADLEWIWSRVKDSGARFFLLGAGSNILVSDEGFPGVVIRLSRLNGELGIHGRNLLAGGSVMVSVLLRRVTQEGWGGLEFLAGIPGSIGGAVRMNAGTHLGEAASRIEKVHALILGERIEDRIYQHSELRFEYRKNLFMPENSVVWSTEWRVEKTDSVLVRSLIDETLTRRKQTQPVNYPSCGSVFKNPKESGLAAWQVIDKLGLRGHRIGSAQFAEKHSNFIINHGSAKAADVRALIALAQSRAQAELGVMLQQEVIFVG